MTIEQTTLPAEVETQQPTTDRRELLEQAFGQSETEKAEQRARDEAGRFAKQEKAAEPPPAPAPTEQSPAPVAPKLTTWKKDYIPLHEKLEQGLPLSADEAKRLAQYNYQRESEYATGISMHKDRAGRLESVERAIEPFMPMLQQHNVTPDKWIAALGNAHAQLVNGNEQQNLQAFMKLAQDYNVPLTGFGQMQNAQGQQPDPHYLSLMEQINQLSNRVQTVDGWREQQEQQRVTAAIAELANDAEKYPHFEKVKGTMAQLLESGYAPDLKTAYAKAVRLDDEVWTAEQARQSQAAEAAKTQSHAVARAKAAAVSPRSATPSGVVGKAPATDRRALLEEAFDASTGRV